mmetsp:Transcript_72725/g.165022  ORF Transcript_72725/g.165022 Transcript_72725/m.165022 type:complete len:350 (+) Transcript_72725:104-1153(+)|eukprot:CAMPEP_0197922482 /NCGR_PEP_ID=MMETSP1439-20131203/92380_1 /TAXON_ID=66791 /ORGANISM="Gonyaulax spinifera, Strain CCMP409" /LENGTH=349 /DNA_ID=CAMNT_0043544789 /DNA_START=98 /DNA_END=1147 /DNA_ORIENTATION=+
MALLFTVIKWAAAAVLSVVCCFVYAVIRAFRYEKKYGRQDKQVPHSAPVELYTGRFSTDAQKLRCCLIEKGVEFKEHFVDVGCYGRFENLSAKNLQRNPNGTSPFLVHDGYPVLETEDVVRYIDGHFGERFLFPTSQEDLDQVVKWATRSSMAPQAGIDPETQMYTLGAATRLLSLPVTASTEKYITVWRTLLAILWHPNPLGEFPKLILWVSLLFGAEPGVPDPAVVRSSFVACVATFADVEKALSDGRRYLVAKKFSYADIGMAACLHRLEMLGLLDMMLGERHPKLRAYWSCLKARGSFGPSFQKVEDNPRAQKMEQVFADFRKALADKGLEGAFGYLNNVEEEED